MGGQRDVVHFHDAARGVAGSPADHEHALFGVQPEGSGLRGGGELDAHDLPEPGRCVPEVGKPRIEAAYAGVFLRELRSGRDVQGQPRRGELHRHVVRVHPAAPGERRRAGVDAQEVRDVGRGWFLAYLHIGARRKTEPFHFGAERSPGAGTLAVALAGDCGAAEHGQFADDGSPAAFDADEAIGAEDQDRPVHRAPVDTEAGGHGCLGFQRSTRRVVAALDSGPEQLGKLPVLGGRCLYRHVSLSKHSCHACVLRIFPGESRRDTWPLDLSPLWPILDVTRDTCPVFGYSDPKGTLMTTETVPAAERRLTPAEVAALFRVDPKTVTRWAKAGKLSSIRTPGGHRRYRESEVRSFLSGGTEVRAFANGTDTSRGPGE